MQHPTCLPPHLTCASSNVQQQSCSVCFLGKSAWQIVCAAVLMLSAGCVFPMQLELRQYINDLLIKTGGAAAPGFPINSCKLYPVRRSPSSWF